MIVIVDVIDDDYNDAQYNINGEHDWVEQSSRAVFTATYYLLFNVYILDLADQSLEINRWLVLFLSRLQAYYIVENCMMMI